MTTPENTAPRYPTYATIEQVGNCNVTVECFVTTVTQDTILLRVPGIDHHNYVSFDRPTGLPNQPSYPWRIHPTSLRRFQPRVQEAMATAAPPTPELADWTTKAIERIKSYAYHVTNRGSASDVVTDLSNAIRRELEAAYERGARERLYKLEWRLGGDGVVCAMSQYGANQMEDAIYALVQDLEQHAIGGIVTKVVPRLVVAVQMLRMRDEGGAEEVLREVLDALSKRDPEAYKSGVEEGWRSMGKPAPKPGAKPTSIVVGESISFDFTAEDREAFGRAAHASAPQQAPWPALHEKVREAYRVQGEAVARVALSRKIDPLVATNA